MESLINAIRNTKDDHRQLPFSVYSSVKEQHLFNVPVLKPLLIVVLRGDKKLGLEGGVTCHAGDFIFLSDSPSVTIRNIPKAAEYLALLIEFDYEDFPELPGHLTTNKHFCLGKGSPVLEKCLQQFIEWSVYSPQSLWSLRKREIIQLICQMGYQGILSMAAHTKTSHKLHHIITEHLADEITIEQLCHRLAMSESSLRRKLKQEGTTIQSIKDQARLGQGLHLVQTTDTSIGLIAEKCGYLSQSRFSERFKKRFGLTPSELRKAK